MAACLSGSDSRGPFANGRRAFLGVAGTGLMVPQRTSTGTVPGGRRVVLGFARNTNQRKARAMNTAGKFNSTTSKIDMDKYRLRRFVDRLIDMGEVEIHDEAVSMTGLCPDHRAHGKGATVQEGRASSGARWSPRRPATASASPRLRDQRRQALRRVFQARSAKPQPIVEVPSDEAPVHAGQDHRQGRRSQQAAVPSAACL